jgi:uroporphyrin-III C-methyltransferase/precorrin-2 dehydrogenase/sirohydrochlorin ferrochelatase
MNTRTPSDARTPRMEPLARLPVFYALTAKRAVVAGGNAAAAWKAELLAAAGARVDVYATDVSDEMREVAAQTTITVHSRAIEPRDLHSAAMAIGAFEDDAEAAVFAAQARAAGIPVNVIDKPQFCDFAFGSIVNRSPLVIGISTDGAAPVFGQAIRAKLEALIPRGFARWAEAARQWRPRVQALALSFRERRRFWEHFTERAVAEPERAPTQSDIDTLMASARGIDQSAGSVALVGAGPGDPELLTLRAVRALQSADVILIDDLVSPQVLDFARREARKMMVGKSGHGPACKQSEINELMVKLAKSGKRVVRLKGGDPMIFGRAGEERLPTSLSKSCPEFRRRRARRRACSCRSRIAPRRGGCNMSRDMIATGSFLQTSIGARLPTLARRRSSTCRRRRCASCRRVPQSMVSIPRRPRLRWRMRRGRMRQSFRAQSVISRIASRPMRPEVPCW